MRALWIKTLATSARTMQLKVGRASSLPREDRGLPTKPLREKLTLFGVRSETSLGRLEALPYLADAVSWLRFHDFTSDQVPIFLPTAPSLIVATIGAVSRWRQAATSP